MFNTKETLDIYTDYLLICPSLSTSTGASALLDKKISHDKFTRLLSSGKINGKLFWETVKPMCHEIKSKEAVLVFDDSIEEKQYTKENDMICWHYDHTFGKSVKGVNFLTALYHSNDMSIPVAVEFVLKTIPFVDKKGKNKKKSEITKNEMFRNMLEKVFYNLYFKYVLTDSWYSSVENMNFVHKKCEKDFIMAIKENRVVALTLEDKSKGIYVNIKSLELEGRTLSVYFKGLDFPVLITKQVFKNEDGSTGALYLASSDTSLTYEEITTIYKKRWKVEEYHKSIKSNSAFSKSPTHTVKTQKSHFLASILAFVKFERLKVRNNMNHYAMKYQLFLAGAKAAYLELKKLSTPKFKKILNL